MSNQDAAVGLVPIGCMSGADWHSKLRRVVMLATDTVAAIFIGDLVELDGTGSVDGKTPSVVKSGVGEASVGVLVSLEPDFTDEGTLSSATFRVNSTLRFGTVAWGSDVLYTVQEDSVGGALTTGDIFNNIDVILGAGSTVTGISGTELDSDTAGTSNALVLRLHSVDESLSNALGTNANWVVSINLQQDVRTTGT